MTGEKVDLGGGAGGKHRHRVLLIEDDPPIRERLAGALAAHGDCIVAEAANLAEARPLLAQQPHDLIVADLGLPDGLAIDFLADARDRPPEIEILVISVIGDETPIPAANAAGPLGLLLQDRMHADNNSNP